MDLARAPVARRVQAALSIVPKEAWASGAGAAAESSSGGAPKASLSPALIRCPLDTGCSRRYGRFSSVACKAVY